MRGYLQRLVEPRAAQREAPPVRAATRSLSPIAERDPRGQVAAFVDPFEPAGAAAPDPAISPPAPIERAAPPPQSAPTPLPAARVPAPAAPKPTPVVQRFLATPPAAALPQAPAMPARAPPAAAAPQATVETLHRPQVTPDTRPPIAPLTPPPLPAAPVPMPVRDLEASEPRRPALPASPRMPIDDSAPARALPPPTMVEHRPALPTPRIDDAPTTPLPEWPTRPARADEPAPPLPRPKLETLDITHGEAPRVPQSATREIIIRERVIAPPEPPKSPSPPPARAPRTAEEASVIGPLGRGGRMRSLLDLALR